MAKSEFTKVKLPNGHLGSPYGEMPGEKDCCGLYIRVYSRITSIENEWIFNTLIINALTTIRPP